MALDVNDLKRRGVSRKSDSVPKRRETKRLGNKYKNRECHRCKKKQKCVHFGPDKEGGCPPKSSKQWGQGRIKASKRGEEDQTYRMRCSVRLLGKLRRRAKKESHKPLSLKTKSSTDKKMEAESRESAKAHSESEEGSCSSNKKASQKQLMKVIAQQQGLKDKIKCANRQ